MVSYFFILLFLFFLLYFSFLYYLASLLLKKTLTSTKTKIDSIFITSPSSLSYNFNKVDENLYRSLISFSKELSHILSSSSSSLSPSLSFNPKLRLLYTITFPTYNFLLKPEAIELEDLINFIKLAINFLPQNSSSSKSSKSSSSSDSSSLTSSSFDSSSSSSFFSQLLNHDEFHLLPTIFQQYIIKIYWSKKLFFSYIKDNSLFSHTSPHYSLIYLLDDLILSSKLLILLMNSFNSYNINSYSNKTLFSPSSSTNSSSSPSNSSTSNSSNSSSPSSSSSIPSIEVTLIDIRSQILLHVLDGLLQLAPFNSSTTSSSPSNPPSSFLYSSLNFPYNTTKNLISNIYSSLSIIPEYILSNQFATNLLPINFLEKLGEIVNSSLSYTYSLIKSKDITHNLIKLNQSNTESSSTSTKNKENKLESTQHSSQNKDNFYYNEINSLLLSSNHPNYLNRSKRGQKLFIDYLKNDLTIFIDDLSSPLSSSTLSPLISPYTSTSIDSTTINSPYSGSSYVSNSSIYNSITSPNLGEYLLNSFKYLDIKIIKLSEYYNINKKNSTKNSFFVTYFSSFFSKNKDFTSFLSPNSTSLSENSSSLLQNSVIITINSSLKDLNYRTKQLQQWLPNVTICPILCGDSNNNNNNGKLNLYYNKKIISPHI